MTKQLLAAPIREAEIDRLKSECQKLKDKGVTPNLKVILVGEFAPSLIYTRNKKKFIENLGAECEIIHLAETVQETELVGLIDKLNSNDSVHGLFVQLPLPNHLSRVDVGELIAQDKDVDGFSSHSLTSLMKGNKGENALIPCTPKGIIEILKFYNIPMEGKNITIIGRSLIVGKPLALLLCNYNATVSICHSRTTNIKDYTKEADIIISAVGIPNFLDDSYLKNDQSQVLIDVGINHDENGKLCGDIDFKKVESSVQSITPVPGGVGPMTILGLAQNLIQATKSITGNQ